MVSIVDTQFGQFQYKPTELEKLADAIALKYGVSLPNLEPAYSNIYNWHLAKGGAFDRHHSLSYFRNPSNGTRQEILLPKNFNDNNKIFSKLYFDKEPRAEVILSKLDNVELAVKSHGGKLTIDLNEGQFRNTVHATLDERVRDKYELDFSRPDMVRFIFSGNEYYKRDGIIFLKNFFDLK